MFNKGSIYPTPRTTPSSVSSTAANADALKAAGDKAQPADKPAPGNAAVQAATDATPAVAKLVVGPSVKLKGAEILDCDTLLVEGRVEATMDSRFIQIAEQGSFDGKVTVDVAEIHGGFNGELTARKQLVIHSTGRISGKIRYGKIVIHEGGEISGDVKSATAAEGKGEEAGAKSAIPMPMSKTA